MNGFDDRLRFARHLVRASLATRVIGILCSVGAVLMILVTLSSVRSSSDRVGFTLMGLAVLLFGVLVWANGVFHASVGKALPTLVALDEKLDGIFARLSQAPPTQAGPAVPAAEPQPVVAAPEPIPEAPPAPVGEPSEPEPVAVTVPEPPQQPEEPVIERVPCPHCGGDIHPQATRCVHCMKKVVR